MEFLEFNLAEALNGASIGFKTDNEKLEEYVNNFAKNGSGNYLYTGIGSDTGIAYIFNSQGIEGIQNVEGIPNGRQLYMISDKIASTSDDGGTRADGDGTVTYKISTLLPKDTMASQVLNGILSRMTLSEIEGLTPARINQISEQAYKMAQSMINVAAKYRDAYGKPESSGTSSTTPTTNTENYLNNIGTAINNLQKNVSSDKAGVFLNNTETKPLYVKNLSSSSGGGGGAISGSISATIQGDIGLTNAANQTAFRVTGNSTIGGGQHNLPIVVDTQTQNTLGAIPIKIAGGLVGEWRKKDSTTKYSVSKIALNSPAYGIALNAADNSELIVTLNVASADQDGLMSDVDYSALDSLKTNVGTSKFKLGSTTYNTLQEVLDAINNRLT